jgi:hypothetical protein
VVIRRKHQGRPRLPALAAGVLRGRRAARACCLQRGRAGRRKNRGFAVRREYVRESPALKKPSSYVWSSLSYHGADGQYAQVNAWRLRDLDKSLPDWSCRGARDDLRLMILRTWPVRGRGQLGICHRTDLTCHAQLSYVATAQSDCRSRVICVPPNNATWYLKIYYVCYRTSEF